MIVPPRLVAGCLLGCAAAALLLFAPSAVCAQTSTTPSLRQSGSYYSGMEGGAARSGSNRQSRGLFSSPASWRSRTWAQGQSGYTPRHLQGVHPEHSHIPPGAIIHEGGGEAIPEGAIFSEEGEIIHGEGHDDVVFAGPHGGACCGDESCGGGCCGDGCCDPCGAANCCLIPCLGMPHNFLLYGGIQGFKGPANRGSDSSFGFNEAVNWGGPLSLLGNDGAGIGGQLGVRGVHSNLSGATGLTFDDRNQLFVTGGLFRRVDCGLQFGAVIDYLREDWDFGLDLAQVRGEVSWVTMSQSEFGFRYHGPVTTDTAEAPPAVAGVDWESTELFALFVRQKVAPIGAECHLYAGFSGDSEGLLGGEVLLPLADHIAMFTDFAYLVPEQGGAAAPFPGSLQESWNLSLGMVLYPDAGFLNPANYYRPLFNVANNGTFMFDVD